MKLNSGEKQFSPSVSRWHRGRGCGGRDPQRYLTSEWDWDEPLIFLQLLQIHVSYDLVTEEKSFNLFVIAILSKSLILE